MTCFDYNVGCALRQQFKARYSEGTLGQFLKQYGTFVHVKGTEWYMSCGINECRDEGIYEVEDELYCADRTAVQFHSYKGNYKPFTLKSCHNFRDRSTSTTIFICDLFDDFRPQHFVGRVCTRGGGFVPWNHFHIRASVCDGSSDESSDDGAQDDIPYPNPQYDTSEDDFLADETFGTDSTTRDGTTEHPGNPGPGDPGRNNAGHNNADSGNTGLATLTMTTPTLATTGPDNITALDKPGPLTQ